MTLPPGYAQLDGPDGQCVGCASPFQFVAGESLVDGRNHWFLETRCTGCNFELLECGRDLPAEPVRGKLLELTGRWVATIIDAAPRTPILQALRKAYRGTIAETRESADRMRGDGLSGTRGELLVLQNELAIRGVHASITNATPGTQNKLPDRPIPTPPHRIGSTPPPIVELVPDALAEPERTRLAAYLHCANCIVVATSGYSVDPVTRDPRDRIREALMTDGVYIWSIAWATLVERYGLGLPADFLAHVQASAYRPPDLTPEELHLALATVEIGARAAGATDGARPGAESNRMPDVLQTSSRPSE